MTDGIACHPIDASGCVDLLDPVDAAELLSADLPGRGFLIFTDSRERKHAAGATPSTRLMMPCSPMQADERVFVTLVWRNFIIVTLSESVVAVVTIL
jgi:hypothetical protein